METLPYLALEKIVEQLTPQDLARCSAVCREWHETFNQDWIWKPHCDPELEKPLRTIPSVATPTFVTPEDDNLTLSPICYWKVAFMRENHLWNNWQGNYIWGFSEDSIEIENENRDIVDVHFLTDTAIVVWHTNYIEVLDVSEKSHVCRARTVVSVNIDLGDDCCVVGTSTLIVEKDCSVDVYSVDMKNELITFKHYISLPVSERFVPVNKRLVKYHFYLFMDDKRSMVTVFDLNTGDILKEDPYPVDVNQNETAEVDTLTTSSTSDFIAVDFKVPDKNNVNKYVVERVFIYSIKGFTFLPADFAIDHTGQVGFRIAVNCHWVAHSFFGTGELIALHLQTGVEIPCHEPGDCIYNLSEWNNGFIFRGSDIESKRKWLKKFCPEQRTFMQRAETIMTCRHPDDCSIEKFVNEKLLIVICFKNNVEPRYFWKLSGKTVMKLKLGDGSDEFPRFLKVNKSFTRFLSKIDTKKLYYVNCLW